VRPAVYSPLLETFRSRATVLVSGERGTGKTALTYELMRARAPNDLIVYIDDFGELNAPPDSTQLYSFLIDRLAEGLLQFLLPRPWAINKCTKDQRLLISYLLTYHTKQLSESRLQEMIRSVQLGPWRRAGLWVYNKTRFLLNYGANAVLDITSDLIRKHIPGLPPLDAAQAPREYFPALQEKLDDVARNKATFALLVETARMCQQVGAGRPLFVLDKIDEEARLENDSAEISSFLRPILTDNKLLLHDQLQFLIACWSVPLDSLKAEVRFQKFSHQRIRT
jgi:hypothetical protein